MRFFLQAVRRCQMPLLHSKSEWENSPNIRAMLLSFVKALKDWRKEDYLEVGLVSVGVAHHGH